MGENLWEVDGGLSSDFISWRSMDDAHAIP